MRRRRRARGRKRATADEMQRRTGARRAGAVRPRCRQPAIRRSFSRVLALIRRWTFRRICVKFRDFATKVWPRLRWGQSVLAFARPARRFTVRRSSGDTGFRVSAPGSALANAGGIRSTGSASRCPPGVAGDPRSPDAPVESAGPEPSFRPNTHLPGDNMLKMTRLAALAAVLLIAAAAAVVTPGRRRRRSLPRLPPPRRRPTAGAPAEPAAAAGPGGEADGDRSGRQPLRPRSAVEGRRHGRQDHAGDPRHHVDGQLVHHRHQGVRAGQDGQRRARPRRRRSGPPRRYAQGADGLKKNSPFRFIAETGLEATAKHVGLLGNVDLNEWITMSIQRAIDNVRAADAGRPRVPGDRRLDRSVRRAVRHGLGHLPRADRDRHRRTGVDRQGRRAPWARR